MQVYKDWETENSPRRYIPKDKDMESERGEKLADECKRPTLWTLRSAGQEVGRKTGPRQEQVFLTPEKRKKKKRGRPDSKRCQRDGRGQEVRMLANRLLYEAGPFQSRGQHFPTWNSTLGSDDTGRDEDLVRLQRQTPFVGKLLAIHPNQARD